MLEITVTSQATKKQPSETGSKSCYLVYLGKRLFGDAYSGLEYDYRGLLQIYNLEGNHAKFEEYSRIFTQWKMLRDLKVANMSDRAISESQISQPVSKVINDFFSMQWVNAEN